MKRRSKVHDAGLARTPSRREAQVMDYVRRILRDQEERRRGPESRRRDAGEPPRREAQVMDYVRRILRDQEERRRGPESRRRDAGESRRRDDGLRDITVCVDITFLILSADANVGGTPIPPPPPAIPKKRPKKRNLEEEQRQSKSKHRAHTQTPYSLHRKVF